jgi:hypothetical protein
MEWCLYFIISTAEMSFAANKEVAMSMEMFQESSFVQV